MRSGSRLPRARHHQPTTTAVSSEAVKRATTIAGWPGKATAVDTRTAGFTAGAASRKVRATAGAMPRRIRLPAIGTAAHSQPGRPTPASPATGTPRTGRRGTTRASTRSESRIEMPAKSSTPSTRKGVDCTTMARKIVLQVATCGWSSSGDAHGPATSARTSTAPTSSTCPIPPTTARTRSTTPEPGRRGGSPPGGDLRVRVTSLVSLLPGLPVMPPSTSGTPGRHWSRPPAWAVRRPPSRRSMERTPPPSTRSPACPTSP